MSREEDTPEVEIVDSGTLAVLNRAEIDVQIATAKRYPRSIAVFKKKALEMATLDEETAQSMFYAMPRREKGGGQKIIEGPSVRLAEIVASAWGNMRSGARIIETGERFVTAQGAAFDLETNVAFQIETRRRITNSEGRRYSDDMIGVTSNAAASIALRQAVFKVVPFAYVKPIYEQAKEVALGKGLSMEQRRTRALAWYEKLGASKGVQPDKMRELVLALIEKKGVEDITNDDLITLTGIKTALVDGETTFDQVFITPAAAAQPPKGSKLDALTDKLKEPAPGEAPGARVDDNRPPGPVTTIAAVVAVGPCPVCGGRVVEDLIGGQAVRFCEKDSSHITPSGQAPPATDTTKEGAGAAEAAAAAPDAPAPVLTSPPTEKATKKR